MHSNRAISVTIIDSSVGHVLTTLPAENVFELGFSPLGTCVITWQRPSKDENGDATKNLKVWRVIEGAQEGAGEGAVEDSVVGRFVQKSQTGWNLQYTSDERYCARVVTNEVQFYKSDDLSTVWNKLCVEGVSDFALSPGKSHSIAVFVPERKVCVSDLINHFPSLPCLFLLPLHYYPSLMAFTDATYYSTEPTGSSQDVCHP
jgi:translation initiation factor 2A